MLASEKFPAEWKELNLLITGVDIKSTENSFLCRVKHGCHSMTVCYYPKSKKIQFKKTIINNSTIHALYCAVNHIKRTGDVDNLVVENDYPMSIKGVTVGVYADERKLSDDDKKQRDIFAGLAMQLYLGSHLDCCDVNHRVIAEKSYEMADAMMKARGE
nr:hypothetical protein Abuela_28 [Pectobacterium phage Abuela]WCD42813.1 hypothetical protein Ymer_43 [Pectobacterium phage Ymer]